MNTIKFRLICPECSAVVIAASPEAIVWELCPACKRHVWDTYDALMADIVTPDRHDDIRGNIHATN